MNCDQAIEFLPWLLNGTLEASDRDEVRKHLESCSHCREALANTKEAWHMFDQHLPTETLVNLAYGEIPDIDPALVERHLASCPQCAAELEMATISRRLEEDDKIAIFPGKPHRKQEQRGAYRAWRATALAASLAGVVAVTGWVHSAWQAQQPDVHFAEQGPGRAGSTQIADVGAQPPQAAMFLNVSPDEAVARGAASQAVEIPAEAAQPVLALGTSRTRSFPAYEIEIRDEHGSPVSTIQGVRLDPNGFYPLLLPKGSLKPGTYTLQVFGVAGDRREPLETYAVRQR